MEAVISIGLLILTNQNIGDLIGRKAEEIAKCMVVNTVIRPITVDVNSVGRIGYVLVDIIFISFITLVRGGQLIYVRY